MFCRNRIKKPYLLYAIYCSNKNELVSIEDCYKCKKGGKQNGKRKTKNRIVYT